MNTIIINIINFFHKPFKLFFTEETFRYIACGGGNTVLGWLIIYFSYNYLFFDFENIHILNFTIKAKTASIISASIINFIIGFYCMRYVVFQNSSLRGRVQLIRYFYTFLINIFLNYFLVIILFTGAFKMPLMPSQIIATFIIVILSFLVQKYFTFK